MKFRGIVNFRWASKKNAQIQTGSVLEIHDFELSNIFLKTDSNLKWNLENFETGSILFLPGGTRLKPELLLQSRNFRLNSEIYFCVTAPLTWPTAEFHPGPRIIFQKSCGDPKA